MSKKYFLIMETQKNLKELLIFSLESTFNMSPIRCDNATQAVQMLKAYDIQMVVAGETENSNDCEQLFKSFVDMAMSSNCVFIDIRKTPATVIYEDRTPNFKFPRSKCIKNLIDQSKELFTIDEDSGRISDYTPISIETLPHLEGINSDLYIYLRGLNKYIKLFKEGDKITHEDIKNKQDKGVEKLYVNSPMYHWILNNIKFLNKSVAEDENFKVNLDVDAKQILEECNVQEEVIDMVHSKTEKMKKQIIKNNNLKNVLKKCLKIKNRKLEYYRENKIKLMSYISCALAKELGWHSEQSYEKLIYSVHIHDILLYSKPLLLMVPDLEYFEEMQDKVSFTDKDKELFLKHPQAIAKIVEQDHNAPKDSYTIVLQHHEKANGTGFPHGFDHKRLHSFSALFIVTQDFVHYILTNKDWSIPDFFERKKDYYKGQVFHKILRVLREIKV